MMLQYDGLDTIGEREEDYIEVNDDSQLMAQDDNTCELPSDGWPKADNVAADVWVNYTYE
jgi:hypothetical protein